MYGKLFTQMYDGTLATRGPWEALVTFQQLIILADSTGVVDMTAEAISRRTTIPLEIVQRGLAALGKPDKHSRSPDEDGRRIIRLDPDRTWGWRIVNHAHYRRIRTEEERREYHRDYQRKRRAKLKNDKDVTPQGSNVKPRKKRKQKFSVSTHTDADAEAQAVSSYSIKPSDARGGPSPDRSKTPRPEPLNSDLPNVIAALHAENEHNRAAQDRATDAAGG